MARRRRYDDEDDDVDDLDAYDLRSARHRDRGVRPRRRFALVAGVAVLAATAWFAPAVIVSTGLRDLPLQGVFAGIDGAVESGGARWEWFGPLAWHDVVLRDRSGRAAAVVPHVAIDRGLLSLLLDRRDLGTVRLTAPEVFVEVRPGGSSLEDVLAPWLAGFADGDGGASPSFALEVVDGRITLVDLEHADGWRLDDLVAAAMVAASGELSDWTLAGHVRRTGVPSPTEMQRRSPGAAARLDRPALAAKATAVLAREGGFSVSSPAAAAGPRRITASAQRLPLGVSAVLATRFATDEFIDGRGDVRFEVALDDNAPRATGAVVLEQGAIRRAGSGIELVSLGGCELPFDLEFSGRRIAVRRLTAISPLVRAEATGVVSLPEHDVWQWAAALVEDDFSVTAQIDLAALAGSLPGGLTVRPDVRLTGGTLDLAAAAHADGADRVLEVRLAARDLAGVRSAIVPAAAAADGATPAIAVQERSIAWGEPFAAWLRGRLPPGRRGTFRIDEARIASAAVEASASGTAADAKIEWTADLGTLFSGAAALFDLGTTNLGGTSRGAIEWTSDARGETSVMRATVGLADFALASHGRPAWQDAEILMEAEATGRLAGTAAMVDRAGLKVAAGGDTFESVLVGGVIVDVAGLLDAADGTPWLRPGPTSKAIVAEGSLLGDVGRWHARLAPLLPATPATPVLGGTVSASATVAAQDDAWRITKAGGEIERFSLVIAGRTIAEPRIITTAAGLIDPLRGRYELSSGEILTPTLSLRTGGLAWASQGRPVSWSDAIRGKVQWQADIGRLARWLVTPETVATWPTTGRAWGTAEVADGQQGETVVVVEATGSQITVASRGVSARPAESGLAGSAATDVAPIWMEPQASVAIELALPRGPRVADVAAPDPGARIDRLALQSSTLGLAAAGTVGSLEERRVLDLGGTVAWDWDQVSRLLTPWTGGALRLSGGGTRPFTVRSPLVPMPEVDTPPTPTSGETATIMLPERWLAATRQTGVEAPRQARIARPVAAAPRRPATFADQLREISLDTSVAWQSAEIGGLPLVAGELPLRLVEGQLACGPFDIGAAGGRIRGAPWISFVTTPWEVVVPPARIVERMSLSDARVQRWIGSLSPLLGRATRTEGFVTVDGGGRCPLTAPLAGEAAGQVLFENVEVTPAGTLQPLVNLLVKLQSAADPRFAFGDKAVLLRVRPEPVRVQLAGGRLQHDALVMDSGPLVVRSSGSVAADGSLAMIVEVALRAEAAGNAPVVARLLRTPLAIPLKGTLDRPQLDARAIDTVVARIVDNTAEAVLRDGLGRGLQGLETLFGNPPPPDTPLTLPPGR